MQSLFCKNKTYSTLLHYLKYIKNTQLKYIDHKILTGKERACSVNISEKNQQLSFIGNENLNRNKNK